PYRGPIVFYREQEIPEGGERDLRLGVASVLDDVDLNTGIERLERALAARNPSTAEPYFQLGLTLQSLGRLPSALEALERAAALAPRNARILLALGNALADAQRQDEALDRYRQAIDVRPDYAEAYTNAGNLLARRGRLGEALEHYEKAIAIRPED